MQIVKISGKNQITLPQYLLDLIRIKKGGKLLVEVEGEKIIARPLREKMSERLSGALKVKPHLRGIPFEVALEETKKIVARELAKK